MRSAPPAWTRPESEPPVGSCDCHWRVLGPRERFPYSPQGAHAPDADVPLDDWLALAEGLGMARGVAVQSSAYGTDNAALLDALKREPTRLRGVAVVGTDVTDDALAGMDAAGVRGLRFKNFAADNFYSGGTGLAALMELAPRMRDLQWHAQIFGGIADIDTVATGLRDYGVPVVLDHYAFMEAAGGTNSRGFRVVWHMLETGRVWLKVSGLYRLSTQPDYADMLPLHRRLVADYPERLLWGSDWPHIRPGAVMPDAGRLLDRFLAWTPSGEARRRILVENPAALYRF